MNALLWNIGGASEDRVTFLRKLAMSLRLNVIFLTETRHRLPSIGLRGWKSTHAPGVHTGVSIWTRGDLEVTKTKTDPNGRYIYATIRGPLWKHKILCVYAPTSGRCDRTAWWRDLNNLKFKPTIFLGDLNLTLNPLRDRRNPLNEQTSRDTLDLAKKFTQSLSDLAVETNNLSYTFKDTSRIDAIFTKSRNSFNYEVIPNPYRDDHNIILFSTRPRPKRTDWRFLPYLFEDPKRNEMLEKALEEVEPANLEDPIDNWIATKNNIIAAVKKLQKHIVKKANKSYHALQRLLKIKSRNRWTWAARLKNLLDDQHKKRILQARVAESSLDILPDVALKRKISAKAGQDRITQIKNPRTNTVVSTQPEIKRAFEDFYTDLYADHTPIEEDVQTLLGTWEDHSGILSHLDRPFSKREIKKTIMSFANSKAPGHDGLSIKPYKMMNKECFKKLRSALNECLHSGRVPEEWKIGTITTLYKKGDKLDIGNRRPITLLCVDYKILSKLITERLNGIITGIIPNYQIGFMPLRLIYDNVITYDMLLKNKVKSINTDFKKAYDSVNHKTLFELLKKIGFPRKVRRLIKSMIQGSKARILVNGELTNWIEILRGVKQGDPLSPLLFTLAIECLARLAKQRIRHPPTINGIFVFILLYADDAALLTTHDDDIRTWEITLEIFGKGFTVFLNMDKSFTINCSLAGMPEMKDVFRYLGFALHPVKGLVNDYDIDVKKMLNRMMLIPTNLPLLSKLHILKVYCLSILWFKAFLLTPNNRADIDKAINTYLWGTQIPKVGAYRRNQPLADGGLNLNILSNRFKAFRASLIEKICFSKDMKVKEFFEHHWAGQGKVDLEANHSIPDAPETIQQALPCWASSIKLARTNLEAYNEAAPLEIKTIERLLYGNPTIKRTKKQEEKLRSLGLDFLACIAFALKISNKRVATVTWLYFQGGLPFPRKGKCPHCNTGTLSHIHIFAECNTIARDFTQRIERTLDRLNPGEENKWSEPKIAEWLSDTNPRTYRRRIATSCALTTLWTHFNSEEPISTDKMLDHFFEVLSDTISNERARAFKAKTLESRDKIIKNWEQTWLSTSLIKLNYKYAQIKHWLLR